MNYSSFGSGNLTPFGNFGVAAYTGMWLVIAVVMLAAFVLKCFALWRAARNDHKGWFIVMMFLNLVGIPEIIYLLTVGKEEKMTVVEKK